VASEFSIFFKNRSIPKDPFTFSNNFGGFAGTQVNLLKY
jgi:hypothetical protein